VVEPGCPAGDQKEAFDQLPLVVKLEVAATTPKAPHQNTAKMPMNCFIHLRKHREAQSQGVEGIATNEFQTK